MNVAELKNNIHKKVVETDDPVILLEINALFDTLSSNDNEEEVNIPQWQIEEGKKRIQQIESGEIKTRPWAEARKELFKK